MPLIFSIFFNLPQFFDRDGDGIVSEADLSGHPPFGSLPHLRGNNSHQTAQVEDYHDAALPGNEMNMGKYTITTFPME
jgi:hypothetical protein